MRGIHFLYVVDVALLTRDQGLDQAFWLLFYNISHKKRVFSAPGKSCEPYKYVASLSL